MLVINKAEIINEINRERSKLESRYVQQGTNLDYIDGLYDLQRKINEVLDRLLRDAVYNGDAGDET